MRNLKRLTTALIIAILLIGVSNVVLATEADENITFIPDELPSVTNTTDNSTTNTENPFDNTNTNNTTNTNNSTNNIVNNANSSQYNNTNLPNAGSEDGVVVMTVVAIFGISAIYAYKKIRDYNIK